MSRIMVAREIGTPIDGKEEEVFIWK